MWQPDTMQRADLPSYLELILPTLCAVQALGGSAKSREITNRLLEDLAVSDEMLSIAYDSGEKPVIVDRMDWARSYAKLCGALESPRRGLFLLTSLGSELLDLPEAEAQARVRELDRKVRAARPRRPRSAAPPTEEEILVEESEDEEPSAWRDELLRRLHQLSPDAFERFVIYLLKTFGLELERVGGTGDEGIDGIGLAPISPVLSSRVAVQAKRYDPTGRPISREVVALFQRDAAAAGAERAVLVTLARVSDAARRAATVATPTVDLIDGPRLCDLVLEQQIGVRSLPVVDNEWFDRFE